jgi:ribonuclease-3
MAGFNDEIRQEAERILDYRFKRPELLSEALTHASVADDRLRSNERMEFFGDAILGCVVCEYLYHNFPEDLEGELTKIKSSVVSRRCCAEVSDAIGLTDLLSLGKGMHNREQLPSSLAAAVYESVVAAIYLDGGDEPARRFILEHMAPRIKEAAASAHQENFKSLLQQHAQKVLEQLPSYRLLDEKGPDHAKCFLVCVEIGGTHYKSAWAANKKEAEQSAALLALEELGVLKIEEDGEATMCSPADTPTDTPGGGA